MNSDKINWQQRNLDLWASIVNYEEGEEEKFRAAVNALADELPPEQIGRATFERACAWDSTGHSDKAIPLYQEALRLGLDGEESRRAVIQMSSSMRNMGRTTEALELLLAEKEHGGNEHLDDALTCTTALVLANLGREREALSMVIRALAKHLPRYNRSMDNYGRLLVEED